MITSRERSRAATAPLLAAALALLTAAVPRCSAVGERATAPAPILAPLSMTGPCLHECAAIRAADFRNETDRYRLAIEACNGDPECLAEEAVLHDAVLAEIDTDSDACRDACR